MWLSTSLALFALAASSPSDLSPEEVSQVDALFEPWDRPDSPGCSLAIVKDGEVVHARGYGAAVLEHGILNGPDTVFRIASTSKQFTAACILLLERDGVLSLEDPVEKWIAGFRSPQGEIRIRHLLHHTSGVRDYLWLMQLAGYDNAGYYTQDMALEVICRQENVDFAPGTEFRYSNSGYFLLSKIVEAASGKTLRDFAEERLFEPLGMTHTHFHDNRAEVVEGRALGYQAAQPGFALNMTQLEMCGDGGLFTTVEDLTKWMANFRTQQVGDAEWIARMTEVGVLNDGEVLDYAKGLMVVDWKGRRQIQHGGAFAGFRAEMLHIPELGFGVVCLANVADFSPSTLCEQVRDALLDEETRSASSPRSQDDAEQADPTDEADPAGKADSVAGDEPEDSGIVELSRAELKHWNGYWLEVDARDARLVRVRASRGKLRLVGSEFGGSYFPRSVTRFLDDEGGVELRFEESIGGQVADRARFTISIDGEIKAVFEQQPTFRPDASDLQKYAGHYWSEELQVIYRLEVVGKDLRCFVRGEDVGELRPVVEDRFRGLYGGRVVFEREAGIPSGFRLGVGDIEGLRFRRLAR